MGEKYTVIARDYKDKAWMYHADTNNLLRAIIALIQAADHEYYIHVPVEEECLSCPKLELETHKAADVMMHKCKHLEFCQSIRSNWEEVKNKNCVDISTQN